MPLREAPADHAQQVSELLFGEEFVVLDEADGWVWGQSAEDDYVGYARADALRGEPLPATDRIGDNALKRLLESIAEMMAGQSLLTPFQVRGAFANYVNLLKADFKSIAASGWGPELIPDEDILQSQFPEVLEELEQAQARLAELQALFSAADDDDFEDTEDTGVMAGSENRHWWFLQLLLSHNFTRERERE